MSIDLAKIKSRLDSFKNSSSKSKSLWKPNPGKNLIRIVPYSHCPDNPFIELYFHYNMNGKTYLSPSSFGRPDPIEEFANKLKKSRDKEEWKQGRSLEPKPRTYVPILIRGKEEEGVYFWGLGRQVYQELLVIINDPDYGDITDLKTGRDITVELKTAEQAGKDFPETKILVKPNQTPAFDFTNKVIMEKVKNQKKVTDLFPELSYEELASVMDAWMNSSKNNTGETADAVADEPAADEPVADPVVEMTAPVKSVTQKKVVVEPTTKDIADEFANLFNKEPASV
jgi:hypothetical protein